MGGGKLFHWMTGACFLAHVGLWSQSILVTDYGSLSGSSMAISKYGTTTLDYGNVTDALRRFNGSYRQRNTYKGLLAKRIMEEINGELDKAMKRNDSLMSRNNDLSFFSRSKKKKNKKMLDLLQVMLDNMRGQLKKQQWMNVVNGEKLNLYQDVMEVLYQAHLLMDKVDEELRRSFIMDYVMGRNKK